MDKRWEWFAYTWLVLMLIPTAVLVVLGDGHDAWTAFEAGLPGAIWGMIFAVWRSGRNQGRKRSMT